MKKFEVKNGFYKDVPAVILSNGVLEAVLLPENGGKMASLKDLRNGREFLLQTDNKVYKPQPYDGDYTQGECSGFDDMFPTIDPVPYPDFPWKGVVMPDHGEVCALRWKCEEMADGLAMRVDGVRFPYYFFKKITFSAENRLRIVYTAENKSAYPFEYIFASHLMLNVEDGGEILLPGADAATWGFSRFPADADYGDKFHWPNAVVAGKTIPLNKTPKFDLEGNNYKFFLDEPLKAGWCGYRYSDNSVFKLHFSPEELPAFCVWVNEGFFHGFRNIALEPCSAPFDRVDIARLHRKISKLEPYEVRTWTLELEVCSK